MDLNGVETVDFNALGGADTITVDDLAGTDVTDVNLNLGAAGGAGDGAADTVIVNGTNGDDVINVADDNGVVTVIGLAAQVKIIALEAQRPADGQRPGRRRRRRGVGLLPGIQLTADGGDGDDVLIGGAATTRCSAATATTC